MKYEQEREKKEQEEAELKEKLLKQQKDFEEQIRKRAKERE